MRFVRYFIFLILLIGICLLLGYQNILFYRPQSIHQWAQCDRASVAYNYFTKGFHFFTPQVHNISNGTGITGLEFPVINYIAAIGYALFGVHEYIYRLIIFLLMVFGLLNAYKLADMMLNGRLIAALPVYLLFVSPVLAYYGIGFLPDPASLGLSLSAWYYFFKWRMSKKKVPLIAAFVFSTFAGLIKISAMINPLAMAAFIFLSAEIPLNNFHGLKQRLYRSIPMLLSFIPVIAWYYYANRLNKLYDSKVFMLEMRPVSSWEEFIAIWREIEQTWLWRFYPRLYFIVLAVGSIVIGAMPQKLNRDLLIITWLLYAGAFSFFFLMFTQFRVHDYYAIAMIPAFFFHWLLILKQLTENVKPVLTHTTAVLLFTLTCFVTVEAKEHVMTAHYKTSWKYGSIVYDSYFFLEPELRKLNIHPDDPVVSIYDLSFNISLYLMNQRGFTIGPLTPQKDIIKELQNPVYKYAILNNFNPSRFDGVMDSLNLGKKMLEWNDLTVYKLNNQ